MGIIYLLDTNIVSEPTRRRPNGNVVAKLAQHRNEFALCTIVISEILTGIYRMPDSAKRRFLETEMKQSMMTSPILDYDLNATYWYAKEFARLANAGKTPSYGDAQIASIAASKNLILVTRNVKHFAPFNGLQIENWFEEE